MDTYMLVALIMGIAICAALVSFFAKREKNDKTFGVAIKKEKTQVWVSFGTAIKVGFGFCLGVVICLIFISLLSLATGGFLFKTFAPDLSRKVNTAPGYSLFLGQ